MYTNNANANTAVGYQALFSNTTGNVHVAVGHGSLRSNTTGAQNTAVGFESMYANTTGGFNVAMGREGLYSNTTGNNSTAVGYQAGYSKTTGNNLSALGYRAGFSLTTGGENTFMGRESGRNTSTGYRNTYLGYYSGRNASTGFQNTFVGDTCGEDMTSGSRNTILGRFNGNQSGLDIRTSSKNIVLSDGDGVPRMHIRADGYIDIGSFSTTGAQGGVQIIPTGGARSSSSSTGFSYHYRFYNPNGQCGYISTQNSGTSYITSSDYRLKENVDYTWDATTRLKQLKPARFNFIADGTDIVVDGFLAHEAQAVVPEAVTGTHNEVDDDGNAVMQGIDQSKLVPLLVKTIQELEARITALEGA